MDFDIENFDPEDDNTTVEFGVSRDNEGQEQLVRVPADMGIQKVLVEMAQDTWSSLNGGEQEPEDFDISELYPNPYPCQLPLDDPLAARIRMLFDAQPNVVGGALQDPNLVGYYYAILTDAQGRRLLGVRRASQLKSIAKKKLFTGTNDGAKLVKGKVFAFNDVFDFLVDSETVWILNPTGFHATAKTQEAVLEAAAENAAQLGNRVPFVAVESLAEFCQEHPSAARILASISHRTDLEQTSRELLESSLEDDGVEFSETDDDELEPADGHEMAFLKVLDRRRYHVRLVEGTTERYEAPSRKAA